MAIAKVLLVDDEPTFVDVIEKRLKKREVDLISAFGGQEALDLIEKTPDVEVVILDVKMPRMDGIETLSELKSRHPLVEVIMLTAHATVESAIEGMKLGAFDYLMKPCELEELIDKVKQAANQKRAHEDKILEARMKEITTRRP